MPIRAVVLLLALGGCNSDGKAAAPSNVEVDKEAALIANAPPEGEIVDNALLELPVTLLDGTATSLKAYQGKALLVVNTASECGYTPQYEDMQTIYAKYRERGLEVLAFPSNDYGGQEPGSSEEIRKFVDENFDVEFPIFEKVTVKGPGKSPVFEVLTQAEGSAKGEVRWNFTKFLVDPSGKVVARFEPDVKPTDAALIEAIERVLPMGT